MFNIAFGSFLLTLLMPSYSERRVSDLKKRMLDLTSDLESANSDLEVAKQSREMTDQELKGTQFQLAMTCASIQALENKEDAEREGFKMKMLEINSRIREFQEMAVKSTSKQSELPLSKGYFTKSEINMIESEESLKGLEENLKCINAEMQMLEAEYEKQLNDHSEVSKELGNLRRKRILVEAIVEESKLLQELAGYPLFIILLPNKRFKIIMKCFSSTFSDKGKENMKLSLTITSRQLNWKGNMLRLEKSWRGSTPARVVVRTTWPVARILNID
ncbi:hypothetical protein FCM35_KLT06189 [Carex littledalei]|uniref:Uncharacterized protein n=1 Tax=Carex littledalei TaxID=544730 RepID=A0A833V8Y6_9POAL|nr:hypothetical protein FCM35_KLT06189 [Carex littledalei]